MKVRQAGLVMAGPMYCEPPFPGGSDIAGKLNLESAPHLQPGKVSTLFGSSRKAPAALRLAGFHNRHHGDTIVVCGCGVSLNEFDHPERFVTIGVNDVGRRFQPTYLVVVNPRRQFHADRFRFVEQSQARYLFSQLAWPEPHPPLVKFRLGTYGGTSFSDPDVLHYTRNSPYVALCLAVQMGARRIGLIGVDFTEHHFFAPTGTHALTRQVSAIDAEYQKLGRVLEASGITVFNLSQQSRLTAFPKMDLKTFAARGECDGPVATSTKPSVRLVRGGADGRPARPFRPAAMIAVEKSKPGIIGDFLGALAATAQRLGHSVSRNPRAWAARRDVISIVWNGRNYRGAGHCICCEHGWLPRWAYQVSPKGINADSHIAPFVWNGQAITDTERAQVRRHLADLRAEAPAALAYTRPDLEPAAGLPEAFILAPLQMTWDTNIQRHVPPEFRTMQRWIDAVSAADPPFPVLFKQHPADQRRGNAHLRLHLRRRQDRIVRSAGANVHQILKTGRCRFILTLNSNVAHDGLIWDVPAIVLGRNVWPEQPPSPFLLELPRDWSEAEQFFSLERTVLCREAYTWHLMRHQWSMEDARSAEKVDQLLSSSRADANWRPSNVGRPSVGGFSAPVINVVATNRGWFFEDLKRHFAAASSPERPVVASEKPRAEAAAWIFVRTREASASPDPGRTVVQLHDLYDGGIYALGGEREAVGRCAALVLTHPEQRTILEHAGISLSAKHVRVQPTGALASFQSREALSPRFTIAWVGRPVIHHGVDLKRVGWLIAAIRQLRLPRSAFQVTLLGERLESTHRELVQDGVTCRYLRRRQHPIETYPQHYRSFDCVVITSVQSAGPNCLFEALASGVPVLSTPVGWAPQLVRPGENGFLVESVSELAAKLQQLHEQRQDWFERRARCRESVAGFGLEAFVQANLEAAAALVRSVVRH